MPYKRTVSASTVPDSTKLFPEKDSSSLKNERSILRSSYEHHMSSIQLNVEDFKKSEDIFYTSETDENIKFDLSTPVYMDSLSNNMDNLSDNKFGYEAFGPTKTRFVVIIITSIVFFLQVFSQSIWSAIYEPALAAFPNWTGRSLALLPIWSSVMTAVLVFPTCLIINKYGLKVSLLWSCCFFTLGTVIRCLPAMHSSTLCLHLSAVCLSAGAVVMTPLMITVSAQWFPKNERNMATGFGSAVGILGSAATYIIGPLMVSADSNVPLDPFLMRRRIMRMLYACLGLNIYVTLLVYLAFPKKVRPVSYTSKLSMASHHSAKLFQSFWTLVTDRDMWCLVLAFTLSNTVLAPWFALLPSTFSRLHVPLEISAKCGLFTIVHTFAMSLSVSTFADRAPGYSKELVVFSRLVSLIFLFWLMLLMNFGAKFTITILVCVVLMAFPYSSCCQSLLYEMGTELMYPLPESFVAGYMTLLNNLFVDIVYIVFYFFPRFDDYWFHISIFVFSVLSVIFLLLTTDRTKTKYTKN